MLKGFWGIAAFILLGVATSLSATDERPGSKVYDPETLRQLLGVVKYRYRNALTQLKIAVLDNGFAGFNAERGHLPAGTQKPIEQFDETVLKALGQTGPRSKLDPSTNHGRLMAQIVWAVMGQPAAGPTFYLLNARDPRQFQRAMKFCVLNKVDIILHSKNFEFGNFNGRGYIHRYIDEAIQAGAIFVNAAGNYGNQVYNGPIAGLGSRKKFRIKSNSDESSVKIVVSWDSFGEFEDTGTNKDLDIHLFDETGKKVGTSTLRQVLKKPDTADGETFLPFEDIDAPLNLNSKNGYYTLELEDISKNFSQRDNVRITVIPGKTGKYADPKTKTELPYIQFMEAQRGREIMVPGDHPDVITVGTRGEYSAIGPTMDKQMGLKPDVLLNIGTFPFTNREEFTGSSGAAAAIAGVIAVMKSYNPDLTARQIISYIRTLPLESRPLAANPIQRQNINDLPQFYSAAVKALKNALGNDPSLVGTRADGRWVVGYRNFAPWQMTGVFPNFAGDGERYEYYIGLLDPTPGQNNPNAEPILRSYTRLKADAAGQGGETYPWDREQTSHMRFLEIERLVGAGGEKPNSTPFRIWKTPSPEKVLEL